MAEAVPDQRAVAHNERGVRAVAADVKTAADQPTRSRIGHRHRVAIGVRDRSDQAVTRGENGRAVTDDHLIVVRAERADFQIERIAQDKGLYGPYSLVRAGERIFFYSAQGFHRIDPGGFPTPIGRERVDRTFFADLDRANLQLFIGAADPRNSRVFWAYKSANGTASQFDKILAYDWVLDRFTPIMRREI